MKKFISLAMILSVMITSTVQARPHGGHRSYSRGHYSSVMHSGDWAILGALTGAVIIGSAIASSNSDDDYDRELDRRERELDRREDAIRAAEDDYYYNNRAYKQNRNSNSSVNSRVIYSDGRTQVLEMSDGTRITLNQ